MSVVRAAGEPPRGRRERVGVALLPEEVAAETWDYVNWLTHAKNAVRLHAEISLKAVDHLLGAFTAARLRFDGAAPLRDLRVVPGRRRQV
jgi:hypothetical protein